MFPFHTSDMSEMTGQILAYREHVPDVHPEAWVAPGAVVLGQVKLAAWGGLLPDRGAGVEPPH